MNSKRGSDEDGELNVDGDDTEEYGKPQYLFLCYKFIIFNYYLLVHKSMASHYIFFSLKFVINH